MTPSELARKSLPLALKPNYNSLCVVTGFQVPRDGLISKLTFAGQFRNSSGSLYPQLHIWEVQGGNGSSGVYKRVFVTGLSIAPQFTSHLNVYEYTINPPVQVRQGHVLGYYQPSSVTSRLGLVTVMDLGPKTHCLSGVNHASIIIFNTKSNSVAELSHAPLMAIKYGKKAVRASILSIHQVLRDTLSKVSY